MLEPTIRPATRGDAEAIHRLHTRSVTTLCADVYSEETISTWLKNRTPEGYYRGIDADLMYVAMINDQVAGFMHVVPGEVHALFVDPDFAGRGVGSVLLNHALAIAAAGHSGPITVTSTLNAEQFYAKHGFVEVRRYSEIRNNVEIPVVDMKLLR